MHRDARPLHTRRRRVAIVVAAVLIAAGAASAVAPAGASTPEAATATPVKLIIDTDIQSDVDDAGALAIANQLQRDKEVKLLAVMVDTRSRWGAPAADAINTYYGHPNIPIGTLKPVDNSVATANYAQVLAKRFPNSVRDGAASPQAVDLYRKILSRQPDHSVTIASVGFFTNLSLLLDSKGDRYSDLNGRQLIARKVKKLVVMGGTYPSGREFNFFSDVAATKHVTSSWPTAQVYSGFEVGEPVMTGARLMAISPVSDPVRKAYEIYVGRGNNRNSWDPTAVYYAIRGGDGLFDLSAKGKVNIAEDGSNTWTDDPSGKQQYLVKSASDQTIARVLEDLMTVRTSPTTD